jgi:hypothetical protein
MRNFILGLIIGVFGLLIVSSFKTVKEKIIVVENPSVIYVTDTLRAVDTIIKRQTTNPFHSFADVLFFAEYVKTESSLLNDDNWAVIKTMLNRVRRSGKSWREFINSPNDHNSPTIISMLQGKRFQPFDINKASDLNLIIRTLQAGQGMYPEHIDRAIPENVYYFESHPDEWNRTPKFPFHRDSIVAKYLHEFYKG